MEKELIVKEYLGNKIEFKMVDGEVYANATTMCKVFGKQPSDWTKNKSTQEYFKELEGSENIPRGIKLIDVVNDGYNNGTWIHEKLILDLARWLNVRFRIWCDEQIATLLRNGSISINPKQNLLLSIIQSATEIERAIALNKYELEYVKPLEIENKQQKDYIDNVVHNEKYYITVTQIGNKFGMSARALNIILEQFGVQYKKGKKWCLKSDYYGIGDYIYFQKPNGEWEKGTSLYFSNEGERVIYKLLSANGYELKN